MSDTSQTVRRGRAARHKEQSQPPPNEERPVHGGVVGGKYGPLSPSDLQRIHRTALDDAFLDYLPFIAVL
ncbi:MAG: hypothetical protein V3V97_09270 [Hyphomicrobiaceae bacterium]